MLRVCVARHSGRPLIRRNVIPKNYMTDPLETSVADSSFQRAAAMPPLADFQQAAAHYRDCLGFTIGGIWSAVPYAIVHPGGVEIHLCRGTNAEQRKQGGVYISKNWRNRQIRTQSRAAR
jgi:hypothetical protein